MSNYRLTAQDNCSTSVCCLVFRLHAVLLLSPRRAAEDLYLLLVFFLLHNQDWRRNLVRRDELGEDASVEAAPRD